MPEEKKSPETAEETPKTETAAKAPEAKAEKAEEKAPAAKAEKPADEKPKAEKAEKAEKSEKAPKSDAKKAKADDAKAKEAPSEEEDPLSLDASPVAKQKVVKAKGYKNVVQGIAHILATFNNTHVTITDMNGNVIGWSSAGKCGFRGSKKSTAYVAQVVAQDACRQAMGHGLKEVTVKVNGPGTGRESAVRALQAIGLEINSITDVTPVPHNGCRPRKQRRV